MTIQITDDFIIVSDCSQFSLLYKPKRKDGSKKEPGLRSIGSYGTIESALRGFLKNYSRCDVIALEVEEVAGYIDSVYEKIEKAIK